MVPNIGTRTIDSVWRELDQSLGNRTNSMHRELMAKIRPEYIAMGPWCPLGKGAMMYRVFRLTYITRCHLLWLLAVSIPKLPKGVTPGGYGRYTWKLSNFTAANPQKLYTQKQTN